MRANNTLVTVLAVVCALQAGWGLAHWLSPEARAESPDTGSGAIDPFATETTEPAPYPGRLLCRTFAVDLPHDATTLPSDDSEAGRWVQSSGDAWQIYTVDLEIGQKSTGWPQAFMQVCLYPR